MKAANALRHTRPAILRGAQLDARNALKYAWWFESFRNMLRTGSYRFSYFKKDGSIREAIGTLDLSRIPAEHQPKPLSGAPDVRPENYETFVYYDLSIPGWRSFRLDNFIGFVEKVNA
jgi:hypothetical protein